MLTALRVSGLALLDDVEVEFGRGMNVITGETGAGKSILLDALHLALGGRMSPDVFREGADEVVVEALFEVGPDHPVMARLDAAGLPVEVGAQELLVRRMASRSGRGRAFVNGALCTVGMLQACLRGLVDVTTQHEHVSLLDESTHLSLLDGFAGLSGTTGPLAEYRDAWTALVRARRERVALEADRDARTRREEEVRFQLGEIDTAEPRAGEVEALEAERQVLVSAERLRVAARTAEALVYSDEESGLARIGRAIRALHDVVGLDPRLEPMLASLRTASAEAEDAGRALGRYADILEGDPERLAAVDDRLAVLRGLCRKYGGTLDAVLAHADALRAAERAAGDAADRFEQLDAEIARALALATDQAAAITRARCDAARTIAAEVQRELDALGMRGCRVQVELTPVPVTPETGVALGADGAETVRLLLAANPGEPARSLARIASGGELSRVLLALKRALARVDPVDTYVFDEVDAGIGGGIAEVVGRLLSGVARQRQVLCVTHLPQVAAFADRHLKVEKRIHRGRTSTVISTLAVVDERRAEVARMLAGLTVTDSALRHAAALMQAARADGARGSTRGARRSVPGAAVTAARVASLTRRSAG